MTDPIPPPRGFSDVFKPEEGGRDAKVIRAINLVLSLSLSLSLSHKRAAEFRELLNEPSSRKPLITKGLSERRAGGKREESIFTGRQLAR